MKYYLSILLSTISLFYVAQAPQLMTNLKHLGTVYSVDASSDSKYLGVFAHMVKMGRMFSSNGSSTY